MRPGCTAGGTVCAKAKPLHAINTTTTAKLAVVRQTGTYRLLPKTVHPAAATSTFYNGKCWPPPSPVCLTTAFWAASAIWLL